MDYEYSRPLFGNGDIVFFSKGKQNLVRRAICWFTKGPNYHVGIAFWMKVIGCADRLMLAESQPDGFRIVNLSSYSDRTMTVFRCPVPWENIRDIVTRSAGEVEYDFFDLAVIGMHERFNMSVPRAWTGPGDVCSSIVARMLNMGGAKFESLVSPQRLHDNFLENKLKAYMVSHD